MCWIEELRNELGEEVRLVSQKGHEHWGFVVGNTYSIVGTAQRGDRVRFKGALSTNGDYQPCPGRNWGWVFETAGPLVVENE